MRRRNQDEECADFEITLNPISEKIRTAELSKTEVKCTVMLSYSYKAHEKNQSWWGQTSQRSLDSGSFELVSSPVYLTIKN